MPPPPFSINAETEEVFCKEVEELCDLLDQSEARGGLFVRWISTTLQQDGGAALVQAAGDGARLLEEMGLGAIIREAPFHLPELLVQLAGAVSTFSSTHNLAQPIATLDVTLSGALLPTLALRGRAREALTEQVLGQVDTVLTIATHVLTHLHCHASVPIHEQLSVAQKGAIKTTLSALMEVLNDTREETALLCTHLIVLLQVCAGCEYYDMIPAHENANCFGVQFISLMNRCKFQNTGGAGDDKMPDVQFMSKLIGIESVATSQASSSSVIYPRDLAVFCEMLEQDVRDQGPASPRGVAYKTLLRAIVASELKPVGCSVDLSQYE